MWRDRYTAQVGEGRRPSAPQTSDPLTKLTALNRESANARPKWSSYRRLPNPQGHERGRRFGTSFVLAGGFAALIALGTLFLMLPPATKPGNTTTLIDALFTATSAVCVTGLVVVDTADHWTTFGHVVILVLIQLGGFGFMTSSILLFMLLGQRIRLRQRVLMREALNISGMGGICQYHTQYRHLDDCHSGSRHLGALALLRAESRALAGVLDGIVSRHIGI